MAGSVSNAKFVEAVQRSGLVNADQLESIAQQHPSGTPDDLAEVLIQNELLTRWQADLLLKGKFRGFRLGSYRLLELIGKGGMGSVYLAEHREMQRLCAIKVLPSSEKGESSGSLDRFYREAKAVAALDHPNIVAAYDVSKQTQGQREIHYLVMEYIEGRTLQEIVEDDGPLSCSEAAEYLRQTARGLAHAHQRGIIHRDIKPSNLILGTDGQVKILDLGLVTAYNDDEAASLSNTNRETLLGTVDYVSPEQSLGSSQLDERTDLYSLGCAAYFLLTGSPPFPNGSVAERLLAHQLREPESIAEIRTDIPQELAIIVETLLAKDPLQRFQTASTVEAEITVWLDKADAVLISDLHRGGGSTIGLRSHAGETRKLSEHATDMPPARVDATAGTPSDTPSTEIARLPPAAAATDSKKLLLVFAVAAVVVATVAILLVMNMTGGGAKKTPDVVDGAPGDIDGSQTVPVAIHKDPASSAAAKSAARMRFERWSRLRDEIKDDADTVLYLSFAERPTRTLANEVRGAEYAGIQVEVHRQPKWVEGRFPHTSAIRLDGPASDQWLQISPEQSKAFDFAGSFTLALWVRLPPFTAEYQCLLAKGDDGWRISRNKRDSFLHFAVNQPERVNTNPSIPSWAHVNGQVPVDDGRWHFVTAVFDAEGDENTMSLYVDGELDGGPVPSPHRSAPNDDFVTIGANQRFLLSPEQPEHRTFHRSPRHLQGDIGEVLIVRRPLSAKRIKQIYDAGRPVTSP